MGDAQYLRRLHILGAQISTKNGKLDHSLLLTQPAQSRHLDEIKYNQLAVFIGGIIMDVQATPSPGQSLYQGGSAMGHVRFIPGGVARNIIHSLQLLSNDPIVTSNITPELLLISAIGNDPSGLSLLQHTKSLGLRTDGIITMPTGHTPTVSIIFNGSTGDVAASVADVDLLEKSLTPERVLLYTDELLRANIVLLDGDVSKETLEEVCMMIKSDGALDKSKKSHKYVWFEPVSVPKAQRATHILSHIDFVSPNIDELKSMAQPLLLVHDTTDNTSIDTAIINNGDIYSILKSVEKELSVVLQTGLRYVVLTLGELGAALCSLTKTQSSMGGIKIHHVPALSANVVNCSGAGDCLVAGCIYALLHLNCPPENALEYGVAAAKEAVESVTNVPLSISVESLQESVMKIQSHSKTFFL